MERRTFAPTPSDCCTAKKALRIALGTDMASRPFICVSIDSVFTVVVVAVLLLFLFKMSVNGPMRASKVSLNAIESNATMIVEMNKKIFI